MIAYLGFLYIILSSIYTFSFAKQTWEENKLASIGAVLLIFISMGISIFVFFRT